MIDAADSSRFEESKAELDSFILMPELSKIPIVILGLFAFFIKQKN